MIKLKLETFKASKSYHTKAANTEKKNLWIDRQRPTRAKQLLVELSVFTFALKVSGDSNIYHLLKSSQFSRTNFTWKLKRSTSTTQTKWIKFKQQQKNKTKPEIQNEDNRLYLLDIFLGKTVTLQIGHSRETKSSCCTKNPFGQHHSSGIKQNSIHICPIRNYKKKLDPNLVLKYQVSSIPLLRGLNWNPCLRKLPQTLIQTY